MLRYLVLPHVQTYTHEEIQHHCSPAVFSSVNLSRVRASMFQYLCLEVLML